jgi:D-sedoheptulose 7-phosphate isomerase
MAVIELLDSVRKAGRVYLIGNGGSYANAMHICNDLLACGIRAYTLDPATMTAGANDHGYETAFARWISVVGERGDLLIALSGSGKSRNILAAIKTAESIGMTVRPIFGAALGQGMQEAEEHQIHIGHEVMKQLRAGK